MKKYETCQNINPNLPAEYLKQNKITFARLYQSPADLAQHTLAMQPADSPIINLPMDNCLEAELLGAKALGYNGDSILQTEPLPYTQKQPICNLEHWRLRNILDALQQLNSKGKTACLNLSGFATVFDALYGSGSFYTQWLRNQSNILEFFSQLQNFYLEIMAMAAKKNIRLFSFAEPTLLLSLIGEGFAAEYSDSVLVPFLQKISALEQPTVFHICALTTRMLRQSPKIIIQARKLPTATPSAKLLQKLCSNSSTPIIIGNNCINHNRIISCWHEIILDQSLSRLSSTAFVK